MAEKKEEAVAYARELAESPCPGNSAAENDEAASGTSVEPKISPGDFVAVVEEDSTLNNPKVLIGRVLYFKKPGDDAALLYYRNVKANNYVLAVDGSCWTENIDSLVSVEMLPSTKLPEQYILKTSRRAIHKQVFRS